MKIAFFTGHIAGEPRKASILLLADSFADMSWQVRVVTVGYSWLTILKGDPRHGYARTLTPNRWFVASEGIKGYLPHTLLNASRMPAHWLNRLSKPFFRWYCGALPQAVAGELADADVIAVESGPGLLLMPQLRRLMPKAKFIYIASDRLATLRVHPVIMDALAAYAAQFDLISVPAAIMKTDFNHPNCRFIPQGVDKKALDGIYTNPYPKGRNIVSVGDMLFDERAVAALAAAVPDWTIHLFGAKARCREKFPNVVEHGEVPFICVVPYILFADIGLAPYRPAAGADYLSHSSLKLKQYTYAKLPVIAPAFATADYGNVMSYDPHDLSSIMQAFQRAQCYDRAGISTEGILSWPEAAQALITALP